MELYDELLVELECPICTNYMSPPIRQCVNGHSVCEACRRKLPRCALCRGKFTESRNLCLEGLAMKLVNPCINKSSGFGTQLSYTGRESQGFKCALENCRWRGRMEDLATHWTSKMHSMPYHESNVCYTKMTKESYYVNMVDAHDKLFWFKCKLARNKLFWAVQFIGNKAEAAIYFYEIEIIKPEWTKKKILMSDYCQWIELENSQLFTDGKCVSVNVDSISDFVQSSAHYEFLLYYMRVNFVKDEKVQAQLPLNAIYVSLISITLLITFLWYKSSVTTVRNKFFNYSWYPRPSPWYKKMWHSIFRIFA